MSEAKIIENKTVASVVRKSMENRAQLPNKGDIYIGTGGKIEEDSNIPDTKGQNIIDAINENATGKNISAGSFTAASFKGNADSATRAANADSSTNATYAQYASADTAKGTIEERLRSAEFTTSDFYSSYRNNFYPTNPHSNSINISLSYIPNADVNTLFFVMIAIYDRSNDKWLNCCMTIGEGKPATGYFMTGISTVQTISCAYSDSDGVYTLVGPPNPSSPGGFRYDLIRAAVLKIA